MIESPRHIAAFEFYMSIGDRRSCRKVAERFNVSETSVRKWLKAHNWIKRSQLRDIENIKKVEQRTDRTVVATKANYRKDIEDSLKIIKDTILSAIDPATKKLNIATKTPSDINALSAAYERLAKLDLLLVGEATENETMTIKVDVDEY